jgi:putative transcriptional regulator
MKLHLLLAERKMTQQELSYQTGIRQATLSNYYNDSYKHITKEHIDILCEYFNCPIENLIEYIPKNPKD